MSAIDPTGTGARIATPSNFPWYSGSALMVAFAAPVLAGTKLVAAARPRRRSLLDRSTSAWLAVYAWIVVMVAFQNAESATENLDHWCDAVRRAAGARDDARAAVGGVDAVDDRRNVVASLQRRGEDDELGASLGVTLEVRFVREHAGALQDNVDGQVAPGQLLQVLLIQSHARLAVNDEAPALRSHVTSVTAVDGVVLQQIGEFFRRDEIVDRRQL